jgi:hypothetical protein
LPRPVKGSFISFNPADPLEVPREIRRLLVFAATGPDTPERAEVRARLRFIACNQIPPPKYISVGSWVSDVSEVRDEFDWAVKNLYELMRIGGCYFRLCSECDQPFLSFHKRRTICKNAACKRLADRARQRETRRILREREAKRREVTETQTIERKLRVIGQAAQRARRHTK